MDEPVRCKCGSYMTGPTTTALGSLEFKCQTCRSTVIRRAEKQERTRMQHGAGKRVFRWY